MKKSPWIVRFFSYKLLIILKKNVIILYNAVKMGG